MAYDYKEETAVTVWERLNGSRSAVLTRAEASAQLTIPSIFPINDFKEDAALDDVYQSFGARAVLNLASKFMQTLFPPTSTFFKLLPSKELEEQIASGDDPTQLDELNKQLVKLETALSNELDRQALRAPIHEALKLLIVTGNACIWKDSDSMSTLSLRDYVVERDAKGNLLDFVARERVSPRSLPDDIKIQDADVKEVTVYTRMVNDGEQYQVYQEVEGVIVSGSEYSIKFGEPTPFIILRWTAMSDSNYGRGLVEHYIGDLRNYEAVNMVIVDTASVMARTIFLVNPNTQHGTDVEKLNDAITGDYIAGHADDITVPQVGKNSDLRSLLEYMQILEQRLSQAFLLFTSRNAERVTAQEIRQVSQQLEETLGGVYTLLADDLQKPLLSLLMKDLNIKLDKQIDPVITTGLEAIGRGNDANKLFQFLEGLQLVPEGWSKVNQGTVVERLAYSTGIALDGLLKTVEEIQQEQEQYAQASAMQQFGDQFASQGGALTANAIAEQQ